jgi:diaminohydroxyphosphoribosylaminopyrimidine deaminase/5-amino-6-(5-phosphoribosylamino)uracil reductase
MDPLDAARGAQPRLDEWHMARALHLAERGAGAVEPNPMVGCVVARGAETIGEGWHRRFGGPHAEIDALAVAGSRAAGSTLYVSLEPCCHQGKTPPCTRAIIAAGIKRVVIATVDPFPQVAGKGIQSLRDAGLHVDLGVLAEKAQQLIAPFQKLHLQRRPWVIAKWAMTLDGRLASRGGSSQWISGERSRQIVHQLRGRVDGILVGRGTALGDDPMLTARPAGPRTALRIVVDSAATLSPESQLVRTTGEFPLLVAVSSSAPTDRVDLLKSRGCEILVCEGTTHAQRLLALLDTLGKRHLTNLLVEGGAGVLGSLFDQKQVDEVHAFIAPKLIGGTQAPGPIGGIGIELMANARTLTDVKWQVVDDDLYLHGRVART